MKNFNKYGIKERQLPFQLIGIKHKVQHTVGEIPQRKFKLTRRILLGQPLVTRKLWSTALRLRIKQPPRPPQS